MVGVYKELEVLKSKLAVLKVDIGILEKYGADSKYEECNWDIIELEGNIRLLENKKQFCPDCGHKLKMEERVYRHLTGSAGEGTPYYIIWDTYICLNCGFFTWDEDSSRRSSKDYWAMDHKDPLFRGTMDGHPKFDSDNKGDRNGRC